MTTAPQVISQHSQRAGQRRAVFFWHAWSALQQQQDFLRQHYPQARLDKVLLALLFPLLWLALAWYTLLWWRPKPNR